MSTFDEKYFHHNRIAAATFLAAATDDDGALTVLQRTAAGLPDIERDTVAGMIQNISRSAAAVADRMGPEAFFDAYSARLLDLEAVLGAAPGN